MKSFIEFIERVYNTIRYNGLFIFLSLLFPFIIWKLDAGTQLLLSIEEGEIGLNLTLTLIIFTACGLSVWCIPTFAIRIFMLVTNLEHLSIQQDHKKIATVNCIYRQLINVYNGKHLTKELCNSTNNFYKEQLPVRYFAIAPWAIFVFALTKVFANTLVMSVTISLLMICILQIDRNKQRIVRLFEKLLIRRQLFSSVSYHRRFRLLGLVYFLSTIVYYPLHLLGLEISSYFFSAIHFIYCTSFYAYLVYMENAEVDNKNINPPQNEYLDTYKISNVNYRSLVIFFILTIFIFYGLNQLQWIEVISPVVVIVATATCYIIFIELFISAQLLIIRIVSDCACTVSDCFLVYKEQNTLLTRSILLKGYKFLLIFACIVLVVITFFASINSHRIRIEQSERGTHFDATARPDLFEHFQHWFIKNRVNEKDSIVYLISGQGGGSRAAAWFFMNMANYQKKDSNFFKRVYCISTVSGSTTGANMFLAAMHYNSINSGTDIKSAAQGLYGRNYMSSSFFGLMFGDLIESVVDAGKLYPRDRNYHLQKEEIKAFEETFGTRDNNYFEKDYYLKYSDTSNTWPLFLINSTIINFGTRGVFAPVKMNFSIARDLYGDFNSSRSYHQKDIPLITCVNQSQAFPILSAYNYVNCVGRLGDGGISENSGCATTQEVYQYLRLKCKKNKGWNNIKFVCINITNSNLEPDFSTQYQRASIFNTLTAALNSPFDGSEKYAYSNINRQVNYLGENKDTVVDLSLDTAITLTRTLSRQAIDSMYQKMIRNDRKLPH